MNKCDSHILAVDTERILWHYLIPGHFSLLPVLYGCKSSNVEVLIDTYSDGSGDISLIDLGESTFTDKQI